MLLLLLLLLLLRLDLVWAKTNCLMKYSKRCKAIKSARCPSKALTRQLEIAKKKKHKKRLKKGKTFGNAMLEKRSLLP